MAQIVIKSLRKEFGAFTAVQSSSFTIEDGEFFMLLGPSGCGKTTTLRMIAGLELPTAGEIFIDGAEVSQKPASQRDIAFVGEDLETGVGELLQLLLYRSDHFRMAMAGIEHRDATAKIDITVPFNIPYFRI